MSLTIHRTHLLVVICCLLFSSGVYAQRNSADTNIVITDTTNLDALFKKARDLSYDNNYAQAQRICQKILEKKPTYYDVRTFLGRTYAWQKQYENARTELSRVLIEKENDFEALSALFDVEYWTESYSVANDYLKVALGYYPTSEALLIKKAKLQIKLEEKNDAALTLRRILDLNPGQKEAVGLMNSLEGRKLSNTFVASFLADLYDAEDVQQLAYLEYDRAFSFGSIAARGNFADKFHQNGFQYELESYVHFTRTTYANLLAGFSDITLFPKTKYITDIYQKLGAGFEFSAGLRILNFSKSTTIYTAYLGNYYKDYWFSVRTFITPKTDKTVIENSVTKTSVTLLVNLRRYFGDSDNYFGIKAGRGRSPDENTTLYTALFLTSYQGGVELQKRAFGRWLLKGELTYAKENLNRVNTPYRQRISTTITLKTAF